MYVGDVVMQARDSMQDPPASLPVPTLSALTLTTGGSVTPGTYFIVLTLVNQWGETSASAELSVSPSGSSLTIQVSWYVLAQILSSPNPPALRIYIGTASGQEYCYLTYYPTNNAVISITSLNGTAIGSPPATNSAYIPDNDGAYMRAAPLFRWLSEGLVQGSRICGGFEDYSGFPSVINFATYIVAGEWTKMTQAWYDGYPVSFSPTGTFFKRNIVTSSILAGWAVSFYNNQVGVELWPQPARTATQTTLAASMALTDTVATLTSTGGFLLPTYGMVQIGSEIMAYNGISGNQLTGLIRGLGGTTPTTWSIGAQVNELNAFFQGKRVFTTVYKPGQSAVQVPVPSGWTDILVDFVMAKFYETERDGQMMKQHLDSFSAKIKDFMRQNRQIAGPQQVGSRDYQFIVFGGTRFGANVIP